MQFNQFNTTNLSWVKEVVLKSIVLFFGQNKYTNIRRFWTIFHRKTRVFSLQKVPKKIRFSVQWLYNIYLTKVKSYLLKTLKYKYCPKFWTCLKWSIIYISGKTARKSRWWLGIGFLLTLKTKKLNAKNPQIKHCPCPNILWYTNLICTIHRPEKNS